MKNKSIKCKFCEARFDDSIAGRRNYGAHIETVHPDEISRDVSCGNELVYLLTTKPRPNIGKCMMCPRKTPWNDAAFRYGKLCSDSCREKYREIARSRMLKTYGKESLLADPEHQVKMLRGRKISGVYKWKDGTEISYVGQYEKDFLEYLENIHGWQSPKDIISNSQELCFIPYAKANGRDSVYIPDFYIANLRLLVEIKASSQYDTREYRLQREREFVDRLPQMTDFLDKNNMYYVHIIDKQYEVFETAVQIITHNASRKKIKSKTRVFLPSTFKKLKSVASRF
jgi:hypothetical protein